MTAVMVTTSEKNSGGGRSKLLDVVVPSQPALVVTSHGAAISHQTQGKDPGAKVEEISTKKRRWNRT